MVSMEIRNSCGSESNKEEKNFTCFEVSIFIVENVTIVLHIVCRNFEHIQLMVRLNIHLLFLDDEKCVALCRYMKGMSFHKSDQIAYLFFFLQMQSK
jgi:hypothetical protein